MALSATDRKILNLIQEDIPFQKEPFKILSGKTKMEEEEFLERLKNFKNKGIIRTFCANLDHSRLGFESSLIALKVSPDKIKSTVKGIIKYPEVTHCYLRHGEYNIWLVFLSPEKGKLKIFLRKLAGRVGRENILNLPTKKKFKLKTKIKI